MNLLKTHIPEFEAWLPVSRKADMPWHLVTDLESIILEACKGLGEEYRVIDKAYVHRDARVHDTAILQGALIIERDASIGPHVMLRNGVLVGEGAHIGGSCEIKQSVIGPRSAVAHLNYVGNSLIGADVNVEAGAVLANHFNERKSKAISVLANGEVIHTGVTKFGALVGDHTRIGANAVTTPGTLLAPHSIVARLELVCQLPNVA